MPQVTIHIGKDGLAVRFAAVLDQFADVGQERARHQRIVVNLRPFAVGLHQHLLHREAHPAHRAHVLDEGNVHVLGQQCEGNLCQCLDRPAAEGYSLLPDRQRFGSQVGVTDLIELREQFYQFFLRQAQDTVHCFSSSP